MNEENLADDKELADLESQIKGEDNTPSESSTEEQTTGDVEEPETEVATEEKGTETETEENLKKGAAKRIKELNQRAKEAEAKAESLAEKLEKLTGASSSDMETYQPNIPSEPLFQPGEEIDAQELERRLIAREQKIIQNTNALITLRNRQNEAINRINSESSEAVRQYPELDPDSEHFNNELSDTVYEAVEAYVKANPYKASVKQFVAKLMKPYKGAVDKEVGKAQENIARQVSQAALRPTSVRKQEKQAEDKSIEELEKELGVYQA
jgi:hypothetical protein